MASQSVWSTRNIIHGETTKLYCSTMALKKKKKSTTVTAGSKSQLKNKSSSEEAAEIPLPEVGVEGKVREEHGVLRTNHYQTSGGELVSAPVPAPSRSSSTSKKKTKKTKKKTSNNMKTDRGSVFRQAPPPSAAAALPSTPLSKTAGGDPQAPSSTSRSPGWLLRSSPGGQGGSFSMIDSLFSPQRGGSSVLAGLSPLKVRCY